MAGEPDFKERRPDEPAPEADAAPDPDELLSDEAKKRLSDLRDGDANYRDLNAEIRDHNAEVRDQSAEARDQKVAGQPDSVGSRRRAASDRTASARDRAASDDDRQHAREDRTVSRWDRSVAQQMATHLLSALDDADDIAVATLLIGQALGRLMTTLDVDAGDALLELEDRAARDGEGLPEAARRIIADPQARRD